MRKFMCITLFLSLCWGYALQAQTPKQIGGKGRKRAFKEYVTINNASFG